MLEAIAVLNVNSRIGINTCSFVRGNGARKRRKRRRKRRKVLISCAAQIQLCVCVESLQRWSAHNAVSKATAVKSVRLQTGMNTSFTVSHTLPANQPHPQTTG